MILNCKNCNKEYKIPPSKMKRGSSYCSNSCKNKHLWSQPWYKEKQSKSHKGYIPTNLEWLILNSKTPQNRKKVSERFMGRPSPFKGMPGKKMSEETKEKIRIAISGPNNYAWIEDRSKLKKYIGSEERRSPAYKYWRKQVWLRDNFTCKIANPDCSGRIEAHHILGWKDHPELRYQVNNGITLCHAHHPRKRAEEKRLITFFQGLVPVSNL